MSKAKLRWITILALAILCVFTLGFALAALPGGRTAHAASTTISDPTDIFDDIDGAEVDFSEFDGNASYVQFALKTGSSVRYRRDLALKWFVSAGEKTEYDGTLMNPGKSDHFTMQFSFAPVSYETRTAGENVYKICPRCGYGEAEGENDLTEGVNVCTICGLDLASPVQFDEFDITFQSAEENVTKEGQTTNALHFEYKLPEDAEEGAEKQLKVFVRNSEFDKDEDVDDPDAATIIGDLSADLKFELEEVEENPGDFTVFLTQGTGEREEIGTFTNIGGYFMEYRSTSSSTPQFPMTFEATMPGFDASALDEKYRDCDDVRQFLFMKDLNGQSFMAGFSDETNHTGPRIEDNAPAVLVINEKIYSFRLGKRFSLSYEAIDVCDESVTVTRQYYMLKKEADPVEGETEGETPAEGNKHYVKPTDSDYSTLSTTSTYFLPTDDEDEVAYVSIRFKLHDYNDANDTYVYLTWYADLDAEVVKPMGDDNYTKLVGYNCSDPNCSNHKEDGYAYSVADHEKLSQDATCTGTVTTGEGDDKTTTPCTKKVSEYEKVEEHNNYFDYIIVNRIDEAVKGPIGPKYLGVKTEEVADLDHPGSSKGVNTPDWDKDGKNALNDYQNEVDNAAEDLSAGDGAYFYLPSLQNIIGSEYADYRNLRFSIYYFKPGAEDGDSPSSATSLRYNNLRFEVDKVGHYVFRVIAQDGDGNAMKYYDEDGDLVTLTSSNVFEIEGIPQFEFDIGYTGPTIEEAGKQSIGYNKQSYSISSFDIVALEGYETEYKLYTFKNTDLASGQKAYSYEELVKLFDEIKDEIDLNGELGSRLAAIREYDDTVTEKDDRWDDTDNDYAWDPESSLSFTPQAVGYYVVEIAVTDGTYPGLNAHAYKVIEITNEADVLYGSSNWIKNNTTAIILFAVSAVLLIAIILLLVIKPNEKNLSEVDLSELKGVKKRTDKPKKK